MATWVKVNGETAEVAPKDGRHFSLPELQAFVGGYIEIVYTVGGRPMVLDEEGKLKDKPLNMRATELYGRSDDWIVGDVLVCDRADLQDDDEEEA